MNFPVGLCVGVLIALFVIAIAVKTSPMKERSDKVKAAIESCEKDLKRTEHCEIIAVPSNALNPVKREN